MPVAISARKHGSLRFGTMTEQPNPELVREIRIDSQTGEPRLVARENLTVRPSITFPPGLYKTLEENRAGEESVVGMGSPRCFGNIRRRDKRRSASAR